MLTGQIGIRRNSTGFMGRRIEWATHSTTHHVVVAVSETHCVSAEPGGTRLRLISDYPHLDWSSFDLTDAQRDTITTLALRSAAVRIPYNYAIYPPLLWQRLTGRPVHGAVADWLASRPHENCSQLADDIYNAAGIHLFPDIARLVTPGDFERLYVRLGFLANVPDPVAERRRSESRMGNTRRQSLRDGQGATLRHTR